MACQAGHDRLAGDGLGFDGRRPTGGASESLRGIASGCETTAFIPFVLFSAIFSGLRHATLVALAAAWSADFLFMGHNHRLFDGACDIFGDGAFLLSSALIIGLVEGIRGHVFDLPASARSGNPEA